MMEQGQTQLVLIRHGQSEWNAKNLFTGWQDVDLSEQGYEEAERAAQLLIENDLTFDKCYCSVLKRSIFTAWTILKEMDLAWVPMRKAWELNERHYGGLQGLNKEEVAAKHGDLQVKAWRRSYETPPPKLNPEKITDHERLKYTKLGLRNVPLGESLEMTQKRVLPFWMDVMTPDIATGKRLLVAAHGNSLRALMMFIEKISSEDITKLEVATGVPIVYTLTHNLKLVDKKILS